MYKILISKDDIAVKETNNPVLGCNDVLVEVVSSFYSVGTESASKANVQLSVLKKAIKYQAQIKDLLGRGDFSTLFKKLNNLQFLRLIKNIIIGVKILLILYVFINCFCILFITFFSIDFR